MTRANMWKRIVRVYHHCCYTRCADCCAGNTICEHGGTRGGIEMSEHRVVSNIRTRQVLCDETCAKKKEDETTIHFHSFGAPSELGLPALLLLADGECVRSFVS